MVGYTLHLICSPARATWLGLNITRGRSAKQWKYSAKVRIFPVVHVLPYLAMDLYPQCLSSCTRNSNFLSLL